MSWSHNRKGNWRKDSSDYISYVHRYVNQRPDYLPTLRKFQAKTKTDKCKLRLLRDENDKKLKILKLLNMLVNEITKNGQTKKIKAILDCVDANLTEMCIIWIQLDNRFSDD